MRKIAGIALIGLFISAVFLWYYESQNFNGQRGDSQLEMSVKPATLSEETSRILNVIGQNNVQLFDLKLNSNQASEVRVWMEHFEHGIKQDDIMNFGTNLSVRTNHEDSGNIYYAQLMVSSILNEDAEKQERTLSMITSLMDQNGSASSSTEVQLPKNTGSRMTWNISEEKKLRLNQPLTLITVIEDDGNSVGLSSISNQQYDEFGKVPEEVEEYDRVILFRIMILGESGLKH